MSAVFLVLGLQFLVLAVVLALALWILCTDDSPFVEYGVRNTCLRCFLLMGAVFGLEIVFFLAGMSIKAGFILLGLKCIVWLGGCMVLFGRSLGQAVLLTLVCWTLEFGVEKLLEVLL